MPSNSPKGFLSRQELDKIFKDAKKKLEEAGKKAEKKKKIEDNIKKSNKIARNVAFRVAKR